MLRKVLTIELVSVKYLHVDLQSWLNFRRSLQNRGSIVCRKKDSGFLLNRNNRDKEFAI
jgi:hypothetical protein